MALPCSFPGGWSTLWSSKGASPAPPAARVPFLARPPSLICACVTLLPFPFNTTLFLAAGNPSWADNTLLESDLKSFLSFFLMLEVRKASTFSFSPGEGETAARPVGVLGAPLAACTDPLPRWSILGDGAGTGGPGWSQSSAGSVSQAPWGDTWLHNAKPSH